jgi:hypothetical protein
MDPINRLTSRHLLPAVLSVAALLTTTAAAPGQTPSDTPLLVQLTSEGIPLTDQVVVRLPPPSLPDGLSGPQQRQIVAKIAGRHGWQQFVRDSAVAPFVLEQAYVKDEQGHRVGHRVDLWFILFGQLDMLDDERLADGLLPDRDAADPARGTVRELTDEELAACRPAGIDKQRDRFVVGEFPLLNRVQLRGVVHVERSPRNDSSRAVAWQLDPHCDGVGGLGSCWRPIARTELGQRQLGAVHPYQGYAGYLKVTALEEPTGAMLCETHIVFHEPADWFSGSNFLRSKTPLLVKEHVDKLRRKLAQ